MKMKFLIASLMSLSMIFQASAQEPLWQGKGRIAISSDGNEHDHDDWAATPLTLALLASRGLQDKVVLYTYSDHVWGSNQTMKGRSYQTAYEHMRESALGGAKQFGYDENRFICAVDNASIAYNAMAEAINNSSKDNPLIIIAAGPMQVVGEGINRSQFDKRKYVTVVSHSGWNNTHSDNIKNKEGWDFHTGWTFAEMIDTFEGKDGGEVKFVQTANQNGGDGYPGLLTPISTYDWVKNSPARNNPVYKKGSWDWLYSRIETCTKKNDTCFDPSDAGMAIFILTGIDKTSPELARKIMENPEISK